MSKGRINTITIPKDFVKDDLVIIPRREYEEFLRFKKIKEFIPIAGEKKALTEARKNKKKNNFLTIDELGQKLGFKN